MRRPTVIGLVVIGTIMSGCALLPAPPTKIECATVEPVACHRIADALIVTKRDEQPGRRVVSVTIFDARGSYDLKFDDGSGESVVID